MFIIVYYFISLFSLFYSQEFTLDELKSSFYLSLPSCSNNPNSNSNSNSNDSNNFSKTKSYINKITNKKAILCPMIKDEEGFLSEWIAYHKMMGFDHIMIFDDQSIDNSYEEIKPWIDIGYVSLRKNWTIDELDIAKRYRSDKFKLAMAEKSLLETECKLKAMEWGYDYFISLDLDEYLIPLTPGVSAVDEMDRFFTNTGRFVMCSKKMAFTASPHIVEPVDLLTIEAYQNRMNIASKMNYYSSTSKKCAYSIKQQPSYDNNTLKYIAECCRFHGCEGHDFTNTNFCHDHYHQKKLLDGVGKPFLELFLIFHYARSLEKFTLKQKTWRTSGGKTEETAKSYPIEKYFERSIGWIHDSTALRYSCQVRELLRNVTNEPVFYRHGDFWYRNPEFGRNLTDPNKRGRFGAPIQPGWKPNVRNPYTYQRYQNQPIKEDIEEEPINTYSSKVVKLKNTKKVALLKEGINRKK